MSDIGIGAEPLDFVDFDSASNMSGIARIHSRLPHRH
jgi:hypothetical protein